MEEVRPDQIDGTPHQGGVRLIFRREKRGMVIVNLDRYSAEEAARIIVRALKAERDSITRAIAAIQEEAR